MPMPFVSAFQQQASSTPIQSPESSIEKCSNVMKTALDIVENCAKNSEELLRLCEQSQTRKAEKSPTVQDIIRRTREDMNRMTQLKTNIAKLNESVESGDRNGIKNNLKSMISGMDNLSDEKIKLVSDMLCLAETSELKSKLEATGRKYDGIEPDTLADDKTRLLVKMMRSRNEKLIVCIGEVYNILKNLLNDDQRMTRSNVQLQPISQSQSPKKLYIIGENLKRRLNEPGWSDPIGSVIIEDLNNSNRQTSSSNVQQSEHRHILDGFLEDENGHMERVVLELSEPIGDLMDFSDDSVDSQRKLTARVQLEGQSLEQSLPVVEIDLSDEAGYVSDDTAKVVAIVLNEQTGVTQPVELALVPTSPGQRIHGQILELRSPEKASKRRNHQRSDNEELNNSAIPGLVDEAAENIFSFLSTPNRQAATYHHQAMFDNMMQDDRQHSARMEMHEDSFERFERKAEEEETRHQLMLSQQGNRINESGRQAPRQGNSENQMIHDLVEEAAETIVNTLVPPQQNASSQGHFEQLPNGRRIPNRHLTFGGTNVSRIPTRRNMRKTLPATMSRLQGPGNIRQSLKYSKILVPLSQQPRVSIGANIQEAGPSGYSPLPPPRPTLARLIQVQKGVPLGSAEGDEIYHFTPNANVSLINQIMRDGFPNPFTQYDPPITMKSMHEGQHKQQVTSIQNRTWSHPITPKIPNASSDLSLDLSLDTAYAQMEAMRAESSKIAENIQIIDEDLEQEEMSLVDLDSSSYLDNSANANGLSLNYSTPKEVNGNTSPRISAVNAMREVARRYDEELQQELENEELSLVDLDD